MSGSVWLRVTAADVDLQMRYLVDGAIAATGVALPAMRQAGAGKTAVHHRSKVGGSHPDAR